LKGVEIVEGSRLVVQDLISSQLCQPIVVNLVFFPLARRERELGNTIEQLFH